MHQGMRLHFYVHSINCISKSEYWINRGKRCAAANIILKKNCSIVVRVWPASCAKALYIHIKSAKLFICDGISAFCGALVVELNARIYIFEFSNMVKAYTLRPSHHCMRLGRNFVVIIREKCIRLSGF